MRYDGRRVVVTGCASGIGAALCGQLRGTRRRGGRPRRAAARWPGRWTVRRTRPLPTPTNGGIGGGTGRRVVQRRGRPSGIRDPLRVVTINFLGTRLFTEAMLPTLGSAVACRRWPRRTTASTCRRWPACWRPTRWPRVCGGATTIRRRFADGGYRLSGRPSSVTPCATPCRWAPGESGSICTAPGVTGDPDPRPAAIGLRPGTSSTPSPNRWAGSPTRLNRRRCWAFPGSAAAGYITGQVIWVDGGNIAARQAADFEKGFPSWQP